MKKTIIVWALMLAVLVVIFVPLYAIKDSHIAISNVCNEFLYPDTCGSGSKQRKD